MSYGRKYPMRATLRQAAAMLNLSLPRILARAGLEPEFFDGPEERLVDAATFFRLWRALEAEVPSTEILLIAAREAAKGPFTPSLFAFSCSPDIATGVERVAVFKPLMGPFRLEARRASGRYVITCEAADARVPMPPVLAAVEAVFLLACARSFSGHPVRPLDLRLPDPDLITPTLAADLGCVPRPGPVMTLVLSDEDARRPLISEDTAFAAVVEQELHSRLAASDAAARGATASERLARVLEDLLPAGQVSVAAAAARMGLSDRSLQRRLQGEGTSFQAELDRVRARLARLYLARGDLSTEEISHLLAYRDPNSFYRAFHAWTGMTPSQARVAQGA
ncbi:helix-turn-helix domain-containing protein [Pseudooceanicola sp. 200-1SW]|uniref:helix-turn-helix domain-containing protein n=1 Tax=Pseudooceanicola sp. 200-1SW TaxID=3425949 RepID=UPI003D7F8EE9